jgi:hypothetical protein
MGQRITIVLDADAARLLPDLAGSSRKQGEYLSGLIRAAAANAEHPPAADLDGLRLQVSLLAGQVASLAGRLSALESRLDHGAG